MLSGLRPLPGSLLGGFQQEDEMNPHRRSIRFLITQARALAVAFAVLAFFAFAAAGARAISGGSPGAPRAMPAHSPATTSTPDILAPPDVIVGEGDGFVSLTVKLSDQSPNTVSVNYATANSTAGANTGCNGDYVAASGTLDFAPGETSKTVQVQILDCNDVERFEAFRFNLSTAINGQIARASTLVGIVAS